MRIKRILIIPSGNLIERLRSIVSCTILANYMQIPWYMHWEINNDCKISINDIVDNKYINLPQEFINISKYYFNPSQNINEIIDNFDKLNKDTLILSTSFQFKHTLMTESEYIKMKRICWNNFKFKQNIVDIVTKLVNDLNNKFTGLDNTIGIDLKKNMLEIENILESKIESHNLICTSNSVFSSNFIEKYKTKLNILPIVHQDKNVQQLFELLTFSNFAEIYSNNNSIISHESTYIHNSVNFTIMDEDIKSIPIGSLLIGRTIVTGLNKLKKIDYQPREFSLKIENNCSSKNITVISCAKNCNNYISNFKNSIEELSKIFKQINVIVAENDSNDNTFNSLKNLENSWNNSEININMEIIKPEIPKEQISRTKKMEIIRNYCMSYYFKNFKSRNYLIDYDESNSAMEYITEHQLIITTSSEHYINTDYLLILDFDTNFEASSILSCFDYENNIWDVLGANQFPDRYYDIWALRSGEDPHNCWGKELNQFDRINYINQRQKIISKENNLIPVDSCFGGAALYKSNILDNVRKEKKWYDSNNGIDCEHVAFHKLLKEKSNAKICINPGLISLQYNNEHYLIK